MRLTQFTDFGLRVMMRVAGEPERRFTTGELSEEFDISINHLRKVVHRLGAAGFVITKRGVGGGIMLARPAPEITVGEIVATLEEGVALVECFREDGGSCVLTPRCLLRARVAAAEQAFLDELRKTKLSECVYHPSSPILPV